jgi:LAO/AO transport system kinase
LSSVDTLLDAALAGERGALARLLSVAERGGRQLLAIEQRIAPLVGRAFVFGVTGPPGAGKSTLINALLPLARGSAGKVAVLAVDPSSPFSGGALLGDRIRMQGRNAGEGIFIRSMASRGELGGMARSASTCVRLFDACGWPLIIIETLGIGQVELDIMDLADAVVVVLNPGWGDEIQANKAGLTEAGDIFLINKADKPGAQQTHRDLIDSLSLLNRPELPPILETVATSGEGLDQFWEALERERERLAVDADRQNRRALRRQQLVRKTLRRQLEQKLDEVMASETAEGLIRNASLGEIDLEATVRQLLAALSKEDDTA